MTIFNPTNMIFNGKEPNYMVLNGKIIWQKENPYRIEYTIEPANDTDTVGKVENGNKIYLPNATYTKLEIIKNDDIVTINDTSLLAKDVKKIIAYYRGTDTEFKFSGLQSTSPKRIKTVEYFNVSNFTDMSYTFYKCPYLENIKGSIFQNDGKVTDMNSMFQDCTSLTNIVFSNTLNTENVTNMAKMFKGCENLVLVNISSFKTSSVTSMNQMFSNCTNLTEIVLDNYFSFASIEDASYMFYKCSSLESVIINSLSPKLQRMKSMFSGCSSIKTINLPILDTDKVTSMDNLFFNCTSLENLRLTNFNTKNVTSCTDAFTNVPSDVNFSFYDSDPDSYSNWTLTEYDTGFNGLFPWNADTYPYYVEYTIRPVNGSDPLNANIEMEETSFFNLYYLPAISKTYITGYPTDGYRNIRVYTDRGIISSNNISDLKSITAGEVDKIRVYIHEDACGFKFEGCNSNYSHALKSVNYINIKNLNSMSSMFAFCTYLETIDLSLINTENVTLMDRLFSGCTSLKSLDLSSFNTENVTNMNFMFKNCTSLEVLNISSFNTRNVESHFCFNMLTGVSSLVDWCYDEDDINSYTNFTLSETDTDFAQDSIIKFPWNLTEYYVEYTIEPDPTILHLDCPVIVGVENYAYLPTMVYGNGSSEYNRKYESVEVTLNDGSVVHTVENVLAADVKKIKIYYPRSITSLRFAGFVHYEANSSGGVNLVGVYPNNLKEIISINTRNFISYSSMFEACDKLTKLDLSSWNTENVTNMAKMFHKCSNLQELNLSSWNTKNVDEDYCYNMFKDIPDNIDWKYDDKNPTESYANFTLTEEQTGYAGEFDWSNVTIYLRYTNVPSGFNYKDLLPYVNIGETILGSSKSYANISYKDNNSYLPINNVQTTQKGDVELKVIYGKKDESINGLYFHDVYKYIKEIEGLYICSHWTYLSFQGCNRLESISLYGDSSNIEFGGTFASCTKLSNIEGLENLNTTNANSLFEMFLGCEELTELDLSNWDISNVTDLAKMFYGCKKLTKLNLSSWDTSHIDKTTDYYTMQMFENVPSTIDWCYDGTNYSNWDLTELNTGYAGTFPWNKD